MDERELNRLTDAYTDGKLAPETIKELRRDENVAREFDSADVIREVLSDAARETAVPLRAQAAWRSAVRQEAKRVRMRKRIRALSTAAAALVVLTGTYALLKLPGSAPSRMTAVDAEVAEVSAAEPEDVFFLSGTETKDTTVRSEIAPFRTENAAPQEEAPSVRCVSMCNTGIRAALDLSEDVGGTPRVYGTVSKTTSGNVTPENVMNSAKASGGMLMSVCVAEDDAVSEIVATVPADELEVFTDTMGLTLDEGSVPAEDGMMNVVIRLDNAPASDRNVPPETPAETDDGSD